MFRTAFHRKYNKLINDGYPPNKAQIFSQAYALKMVNGWAYEYAAHAKSKIVRGEWRTIDEIEGGKIVKKAEGVAGAGSEVAFHLLHYPMSLFETHYDALKGIHKSLLAKQGFQSGEIAYAMRYAGVSLLVSAASAMTNTDFTNIIENESVERIQRTMDDLTEFDNPDKGTFGLIAELSGTTIGTLKHIAVANEIIDIEDSDLNKILFGNVDFSKPDDKLSAMYGAYQWSTVWGVTKNKIWPSLKAGRGRDLITHWLKLYPNEYTKKAHEMIFGKTKEQKKTKILTDIERAVSILEGMHRS